MFIDINNMSRHKKHKNQQSAVGKITNSMSKFYDLIIIGSTVSLGLSNIASDIMTSSDPIATKLGKIGKRLFGRFTGIDAGQGGFVLNIGGAFSNGQFLSGIAAVFAAKILGAGQKMVGVHVVPTGKIRKWGRVNTAVGFGTGLISVDPPSLSSILGSFGTQFGSSSQSITVNNNAPQIGVN